LGSTKEHPLDVRFVAATNRDLDREVQSGNFRADLLFRLDGMRLRLPPLRDRRSEVLALAVGFLAQASSREGLPPPQLSAPAIEALLEHTWPGNIRELRNVMERAMVLCESGTIGPEDLIIDQSGPVTSPSLEGRGDDTFQQREEQVPARRSGDLRAAARGPFTREAIVLALDRCAGNQTRAAVLLGIARRTLVDKIRLFDLPRPRKPRRERGAATALPRFDELTVPRPRTTRGRKRMTGLEPVCC
jgi:DNA-binding NtrC family response regulator